MRHVVALDGDGDDEAKIPRGMTRFSELRAKPPPLPRRGRESSPPPPLRLSRDFSPHDTVLLPYSSGTTGLPKGVELTHANLVHNIDQQHDAETRFYDDAPLISPLPLFHIYGMVCSLQTPLQFGKTLVTMKRFDLERFCALAQQHRPSRAHVVPPVILGLAKSSVVDKYDLSSLRVLMSAAAPLSGDVQAACSSRLRVQVKQAWGLSEISPIGTMCPDDAVADERNAGNSGVPVALTEVKVVDKDGRALPAGREGELCLRGPQVMRGYLNEPAKTRETMDADGFFKTGDVAVVEERGFVIIRGASPSAGASESPSLAARGLTRCAAPQTASRSSSSTRASRSRPRSWRGCSTRTRTCSTRS